MLRILAINGSLRTGSHNGALLRAAAALLPPGAELVELTGLAHRSRLQRGPTTPARRRPPWRRCAGRWRRRTPCSSARRSTTRSIPGQLKNALDWASRPFPDNALRGKPAAVIGASTGMFGAVWAQAELRKVLHTIGAHVVDRSCRCPSPMSASTRAAGWRTTCCARSSATCSSELVAGARRGRHAGEPPIALAS